ncbi:hypothetical protein HK096_007260, partial [Nowakowskiella sp. JEL0078]
MSSLNMNVIVKTIDPSSPRKSKIPKKAVLTLTQSAIDQLKLLQSKSENKSILK